MDRRKGEEVRGKKLYVPQKGETRESRKTPRGEILPTGRSVRIMFEGDIPAHLTREKRGNLRVTIDHSGK